jgi:transporter family-2 protein
MLLLVALVAGMCAPLQFNMNTALRDVAGEPALAATISFFIATIALIVTVVIMRETVPEIGTIASVPWWMWTGGLLGAF